jgi:hypothetical protein
MFQSDQFSEGKPFSEYRMPSSIYQNSLHEKFSPLIVQKAGVPKHAPGEQPFTSSALYGNGHIDHGNTVRQ